MTVTISDGLIVAATLLSPVIALRVQKWIEERKERRRLQLQVFYDLMATRASRVSQKHVEALNRIDIEFRPSVRAENSVLHKWRIYADHLNTRLEEATEAAVLQWNIKRDDLFTDLLEALSAALGYNFDRVQLSRGIYFPVAHSKAEMRREVFEDSLIKLLVGETSLNMKVTEIPGDPETLEAQKAACKAITDAMNGGVLNVKRAE